MNYILYEKKNGGLIRITQFSDYTTTKNTIHVLKVLNPDIEIVIRRVRKR